MTAFLLKENETYLSVNWLKSEGDIGIDRSVDEVRAAFVTKGYGLRKNGRFAIDSKQGRLRVQSMESPAGGRVDPFPVVFWGCARPSESERFAG